MNNINLRLPRDIIEVIFSKLPIINLPACRVVCKNWNDLILNYASSPSSSSSKVIPQISSTPFLCTIYDKMHCFDFSRKYLGGMSFLASLGSKNYYWSRPYIKCSCNGLLLIYTPLDLFKNRYLLDIFNPMTNEYLKVPGNHNSYGDDYAFGFGYSLKTKRYKVVRVPKIKRDNNFEVFTFGGSKKYNQWRCVEHVLPFLIGEDGVYFNGALYWIGQKEKGSGIEYVICCFDLENEKIRSTISLPIIIPPRQVTLDAFNDSVYVTFLFMHPRYEIEVWRMQNCGREDSWRREFVIKEVPKCWYMGFGSENTYLKLVKCYEDGEILCLIKCKFFILYNPMYESIKILNLGATKLYLFSSICRLDSFQFGSLQKILAGDDTID